MLVLSRKKDQSLVIDGQIEVQVLRIKGNTVRLGIKAPSNIKVLRGELSPFEIEMKSTDLVKSSELTGDEQPKFPTENLDPLPNPFAVATAS